MRAQKQRQEVGLEIAPLPEARATWLAHAGKTWDWLADIEDWGEKPPVGEG